MPSSIKGTGIQVYLDWLMARVEPAQVAAIQARLPSPSRLTVLENLLPSVQYPYSVYAELLEASHDVLGSAYERLAFDHGRYAADALLADVYRLTVKPGDVGRTLVHLARGWRFLFDTGQIEITEETAGRYVFRISDPSYHRLHPPISAGYVQRACEIAGATNAAVEVRGSPPTVEMVITWS